jgi:hypothetical protein
MSDQVPTVQVNNATTQDHDLLITLNTKFDIFSAKLDVLSVQLVDRVEALEHDLIASKADRANMHEQMREADSAASKANDRLDFLTKWFWVATGALYVINFLIGYWLITHYGNAPVAP